MPIAVCKKLIWTIDFSGFSVQWVSIALLAVSLVLMTVRRGFGLGFGDMGLLILEKAEEKKKKKKGFLGIKFLLLGVQLGPPLPLSYSELGWEVGEE